MDVWSTLDAGEPSAAFRADDQAAEKVDPAGWGMLSIAGDSFLHTLKDIMGNKGGSIVGDAVHFADVGSVFEHLMYGLIAYANAEFFIKLHHSTVHGAAIGHKPKDVLDGRSVFIRHGMLINHLQTYGDAPCNDFPALLFPGKDIPDALSCLIALVLSNGKFQVQHQDAVGSGSVILLSCAFPIHAISIQLFLDLVKVGDIPKPAVKAFYDDDIHKPFFNIGKEPLQFLSMAHGFSRRYSLIGVDSNDYITMFLGVIEQIRPLLTEGQPMAGLLIGGYTDIERSSFGHNKTPPYIGRKFPMKVL